MAYASFEPFVAPARPRSELWRTALGLALAMVLYAGGAMAIIVLGGLVFQRWVEPWEIADGATPIALSILLFHFVAMAAAIALVVRFLHKRPVRTLFGDRGRLWRDFRAMALIATVVAIILGGVAYTVVDLAPKTPFGTWLLFLPLALPLILVQTGAEELVFRGYLLQQLGARFGVAARAIWLAVPALIFTLLHIDPASQGANLWAVMAIVTLFAVLTAEITARTGSIGAAWGLHFVNNVQAMLLFSLAGPLDGLSLATVGFSAAAPEALPLLAMDAFGLLLVFGIWRYRHG